jgi:Cof subfamily protein (haloacid dehalogenase superfamily)
LIASDIDGTLLGLGDRVSARTASMVDQVLAAEVPFVLVTGRPPRWVPVVARSLGTTGYAVCANGAALYDIGADQLVWQRGIDPVRLADVARALEIVLPGASMATERVGTSASISPFIALESYEHPWEGSDHLVGTRAEVLGHHAVKLLFADSRMTSAEMALAATAVLGDEFAITYSSNSGLIEISAPDVTKASGLADVAERFGVDAADVITFGDMPNDVAMLEWAGHGVAMGNAHQDVLDVADEVTTTNEEDGVALVLERWF